MQTHFNSFSEDRGTVLILMINFLKGAPTLGDDDDHSLSD